MPQRAMRQALQPVTSCPSMQTLPDVGGIWPARRLTSVLLPAPFGPIPHPAHQPKLNIRHRTSPPSAQKPNLERRSSHAIAVRQGRGAAAARQPECRPSTRRWRSGDAAGAIHVLGHSARDQPMQCTDAAKRPHPGASAERCQPTVQLTRHLSTPPVAVRQLTAMQAASFNRVTAPQRHAVLVSTDAKQCAAGQGPYQPPQPRVSRQHDQIDSRTPAAVLRPITAKPRIGALDRAIAPPPSCIVEDEEQHLSEGRGGRRKKRKPRVTNGPISPAPVAAPMPAGKPIRATVEPRASGRADAHDAVKNAAWARLTMPAPPTRSCRLSANIAAIIAVEASCM